MSVRDLLHVEFVQRQPQDVQSELERNSDGSWELHGGQPSRHVATKDR